MNLDEYAGAWFDADSGQLHVAISDSTHAERLAQLGAVPVSANWALRDLKALKSHIREDAFLSQNGQLRALYVDYRLNRLVASVAPGSVQAVREHLAQYADKVEVVEAGEIPELTTDVRGADGTRNYTFEEDTGFTYEAPCSIGAIVEQGFYTAGHCNEVGDDIRWAATYTPLGVTQASTLPSALATQGDIAWVATVSGWTLVPKVNGYSDGIINVPAKWSGTSEYPIGSTVCRYGQTSGGPHCGIVKYLDTDHIFNVLGWIADVTWVQGSCSSDGDSGGTWLSASGSQVQGTTIGRSSGNTCPNTTPSDPNKFTYFQPISDHIAAYEGSAGGLLTTHGAAVPALSGWLCSSSSGWFTCNFDYFNSQSYTTHTWYLNNVVQSEQGTQLSDICSTGYLVRVKLVLQNLYGTFTKNELFTCEF